MELNIDSLKNEIKIEVEKGLFLLNQEFEINKENLIIQYEESMWKSLDRIYELQQDKIINILGSISFVLSRVEISNKNYNYYIVLSGEKLYVDVYDITLQMDVYFFYKWLNEITNNSCLLSHLYVNENICVSQIECEVFKYIKYFNQYVVYMLREIFQKNKIISQVEKLNRSNTFVIFQNVVYEQPYYIYGNDNLT